MTPNYLWIAAGVLWTITGILTFNNNQQLGLTQIGLGMLHIGLGSK